jgi:UDPglucose 6-dehydrogenase
MLKIGIIGYGFVGKAIYRTFEHNAEIVIVDPKESDETVAGLSNHRPSVVFVCLPAPTLVDSSVDTALIYEVFTQLTSAEFKGLVVLKSTIPPETAEDLFETFTQLNYIYSPEFLRENKWKEDALNPSMILMAGNFFECRELEDIYRNHSHVHTDTKYAYVNYKEASLIKYAINTFLATKVVFMNQLYQLYLDTYNSTTMQPESWKAITDVLKLDPRIGNSHLMVPGNGENFGYGGSCFPKDVKAMIGFDKNNRLTVLREAELANTKIRLEDR